MRCRRAECGCRIVANVEVTDPEVAPNAGKRGFLLDGLFPEKNGFLVAAATVQQVGEI